VTILDEGDEIGIGLDRVWELMATASSTERVRLRKREE